MREKLARPSLQGEAKEENQPRGPIGAEQPERELRRRRVEAAQLPGEMQTVEAEPDLRDQAPAAGDQGRLSEQSREEIENADAEPHLRAEQPRGRFDADDGVVARVLQRV